MSRWIEELDDELFEELRPSEPLLLIDFYAGWCGPCKAMAPVVERAAKHYSGRITFGKLNIDYSPTTAARYGVSSIPKLIFFRNGKAASRAQGYISDARLRTHLDRHASAPPDSNETVTAPRDGFLGRLFGVQ